MNAQNCLEILRSIKDVAFATIDRDGKPQVRMIDMMLIEEGKLFFCTARGKDFYQELCDLPEAAITGMNEKYQMVRFNAKVKKLSDQKYWIDRIFEENPSMKDVYPGDSRYILEPFVMDEGTLEFFDLGVSPIHRESFALKMPVKEKGFLISDACIGCGTCQRNCPQQAIIKGTPYVIKQEQCLHCGLCFEKCPVKAIFRRGLSR
ncbi:hypothetical protein SG0102_14230 [Intestinibaculum porci]|uniref:4Fe-4S ferredoxin-type domain-containing protein n=1 Tax=Intestinibaculum porci TaxID=2487118 RepID=A0A3G9JTH5_9FIRM|nr:4Fe-4S binding protein [Intestinibaculum porci]BBH26489.1 hypothetical protein SG0102_14230 [Intestinibaculum porci]